MIGLSQQVFTVATDNNNLLEDNQPMVLPPTQLMGEGNNSLLNPSESLKRTIPSTSEDFITMANKLLKYFGVSPLTFYGGDVEKVRYPGITVRYFRV